jgi:glycosyltransferase involved in cell wall biosynthesis
MKSNSTISIALATFNGGAYIQEQLDSLASQLLLPMELVVSDDGSNDQTIDLIQNFSRVAPFPVKLVQNRERLGYGLNFLNAASLCAGSHIAFCDQDDVWLPQKIARISSILQSGSFDLVAHSAKVVDRQLNLLGANFPDIQLENSLNESDKSVDVFWPGFSLTISQSLLSEVNLAVSLLPGKPNFAHDELICELVGDRSLYLIAEPLALYRQHCNNLIGFHGAMLARADLPKKS